MTDLFSLGIKYFSVVRYGNKQITRIRKQILKNMQKNEQNFDSVNAWGFCLFLRVNLVA